ncbi:hypothetical protein JCM11641_006065 [Rhodosporidiobolus odoratus]
MPVHSLPTELIADILDTFVVLFPSHSQRLPNLASFALVNRTWSAISTGYLYRNLYLDSTARDGILSALEQNPWLAPMVRTLTLSGGKLDAVAFSRMQRLLVQCTNVRSLSYHCFDEVYLADLTTFIGVAWPGLKYLRADQSQHLFNLLGHLPHLEELIASYIEVPASVHALAAATVTPLPPSRPTTPGGSTSLNASGTPTRPVRPTFKLRRFDSGTSPSPLNFHLLTSSSQSSLRSLDLPLTSQTSQDLGSFTSLSFLTLTLAERYIPLDADLPQPRQPGAPASQRDDARCLRRLKRVLSGAESAGVPLKRLEVYEPQYSGTSPFKAETFEEEDVLAAVPTSVEELDLSTCAVGLEYIKKTFSPAPAPLTAGEEGEEEEAEEEAAEQERVCKGLRSIILGVRTAGTIEEARGTMEVLAKRGVAVRWA